MAGCPSAACDLQNAVNRFSSDPDIGFNPIAVDGIIGKQSAQATFWALTSIANISGDPLQANALLSGPNQLNTPDDVATNAASLAALINSGAVALGLPIVSAPAAPSTPQAQLVPRTQAGQIRQAQITAAKPAVGASFLDAVPPWGPYVAGGLAILAGIYWLMSSKKKKTEVAGYRRDGYYR